METEKSFSGEEAEKDFCGRLFFLAAIFPFSNEKACLGVTAKTDFFYRLKLGSTFRCYRVSACRKRSPQGGLFLVKQGEIWYNKYG